MVTDPPYAVDLDSEWRDRAGINKHGPAESSYMKHRIKGHPRPISLATRFQTGRTPSGWFARCNARMSGTRRDLNHAKRGQLARCAIPEVDYIA